MIFWLSLPSKVLHPYGQPKTSTCPREIFLWQLWDWGWWVWTWQCVSNRPHLSTVVPVIAIFTKFDARDKQSFSILQDHGQSWHDAKSNAKVHAEREFQPFVVDLYKSLHCPKDHVFLRSEISDLSLYNFIMSDQSIRYACQGFHLWKSHWENSRCSDWWCDIAAFCVNTADRFELDNQVCCGMVRFCEMMWWILQEQICREIVGRIRHMYGTPVSDTVRDTMNWFPKVWVGVYMLF